MKNSQAKPINVAIPATLHAKILKLANAKGMKLRALTEQLLEIAIKMRIVA